ncbi:penicillin acylase family protein [Pyrinomonas methylaliphatogenes]|uniref:Penicilin amidase n=1 Tax=Pyrinomonas methylaliphatogenes TaxID=454194 RepID=A0A0B6WT10_9BACT|nr:penicillin acylase family protein [Pyrinomonas methylaliphatogenes]CDM64116.1 penicilin amidase [Pyrinomonas methylaliphatogenes]
MRNSVTLLSALFLLSIIPGFHLHTQQVASNDTSRVIDLAGLRASVTIRRDARGIPYIEAENEEDLFFAQGYVTASDRLWQMDLLRRTARGELSEIFGKTTLEEDKRRRTYGFALLAEQAYAKASPELRRALEAYARGVNAYIASLTDQNLPAEFRLLRYRPQPWRPTDSILIGKIFAEVLSTTWQTDLMRASLRDLLQDRLQQLLPTTSPLDVIVIGSDQRSISAQTGRREGARDAPLPSGSLLAEMRRAAELDRRSLERVGLYVEDLAASNNWVVAGTRTTSGKPLLANDPHLPASAPSIWHMVHLSLPNLRVAGVTAPGAPGVILGHNDRIAWGATNLGPDVQDLYLEKFDANNPKRYLTPQGWREAAIRREEIRVRRNFTDTTTDVVVHEVTITRHGPIILERGAERYALRWTALDPDAIEFEAFYALNRARNWDEFCDALRKYRGPTQNFVYADVDGHIGYYGAGLIPIRRKGDGSLPYDGTTDDGEWTSYIPFEKLPHVFDPPSGMIVTANNRVVGLDYPYHLTYSWIAPYRARRIWDLLQAKQKLSIEDFAQIQGDTYSIGGHLFAREAAKLIREAFSDDARMKSVAGLLDGWDGQLEPTSRVAPLVAEMKQAFRQRIIAAAIGPERARDFRWGNEATLLDRLIQERPTDWLPREFKNYAELIRACYEDARAALSARLGQNEDEWTWGRYAQARFPHPLASIPLIGQAFAIAPVPQRGSGNGLIATVNVGAGVSMRLIADASDWDRTRQGIALGVSGDPASQHWKDQLNDWLAARPSLFPFSAKAVATTAQVEAVLRPTTQTAERNPIRREHRANGSFAGTER